MSHWEAMGRCVGKDGDEIAAEILMAYSSVRRWTRPHDGENDSGSRGPGEQLYRIMKKSLELGRASSDAFAPIDEIETLLGRVCIETLPHNKSIADLAAELGRTMKETGEALAVNSKDLSDRHITPRERKEMIKESKEALRQWATLVMALEGSKE